MKVIKVFSENSPMYDMSKDRVLLDLSYNEYQKLKCLIDLAHWDMYRFPEHQEIICKKAKSLYQTLLNAKEQSSIWTKEPKRIKFTRREDDLL